MTDIPCKNCVCLAICKARYINEFEGRRLQGLIYLMSGCILLKEFAKGITNYTISHKKEVQFYNFMENRDYEKSSM